ncbi:uncharacterized protein LOC101450038 [Ceratitis capitata]|uniref:uncharacterized protein LOC101450038 n=1 Tax=Ceratitis capitata TaxID=7213 RepID=UPI0003298310|nr:uncharacterized protein LOC101450038 [Ceratitis capitata]XP_020713077.1 uncharacterized protein LOC101450038 [Ceratitis capitata]
MSELFVDMHQRRTSAPWTLAAKQQNNIQSYKNNSSSNCNGIESARMPDTRCSSEKSTTTASTMTKDAYSAADVDDELANVLSLQLRKPKNWRWELSTSRSCSNIALPRILLYDHKGTLLLDADNQVEQCYSQPKAAARQRSTEKVTNSEKQRTHKPLNKAVTSNLTQSIKQALNRQFSGLQIQEATPSPVPSCNHSTVHTPSTEHTSTLSSAIDFYTNDLPDCRIERRANSLKGVRFKVHDDVSVAKGIPNSFNINSLPTPPSTTTNTPSNSSSSGPREKRRYRRSQSSGRSPATSESILERFSFNKGRFSSPEYAEEHEVYHAPRYFLRTCRAGTLLLQEESFSRYRRRRRARNSSTENILSGAGSGSKSSLKMSDNGGGAQRKLNAKATANGVSEGQSFGSASNEIQVARRKVIPVRRFRSDGNVLLHEQLTSSDDHDESRHTARDTERVQRPKRKYSGNRKQSRRALITIDPENGVQPAGDTSE